MYMGETIIYNSKVVNLQSLRAPSCEKKKTLPTLLSLRACIIIIALLF